MQSLRRRPTLSTSVNLAILCRVNIHRIDRREREKGFEFGAVFSSVVPPGPDMDLGAVAALSPLAADVFESPWPQDLAEDDHEAVLEAVEFPDFCCQVRPFRGQI